MYCRFAEPTQKLDVEGNASDSNQAPGQSLRQKELENADAAGEDWHPARSLNKEG